MTSPLEQKKIKLSGPSMVTANRTWDGVVIYRTAQQGWSANLADAAIVVGAVVLALSSFAVSHDPEPTRDAG